MPRRKCTDCHPSKAKDLLYYPFYLLKLESGLHIKQKPQYCSNCLPNLVDAISKCNDLDETENNPPITIGFLSQADAKKYMTNKTEESVAHKFATNGLAIVKHDGVKHMINSMIQLSHNNMTCVPLKRSKRPNTCDNFRERKGFKMSLLRHEMVSDGTANHGERTWMKIYPNRTEVSIERQADWSEMIRDASCDYLEPVIEQLLLPDHYYMMLSVANGKAKIEEQKKNSANDEVLTKRQTCENICIDGKCFKKFERRKKGAEDELLSLQNVNVLCKGTGLDKRQTCHIDGKGFNIVAIIVGHCGKKGYEFHYIPNTHNLMAHHNEKQSLPTQMLQEIVVQQGEMILLLESTIHCGGKSLMTEDEQEREKNSRCALNCDWIDAWMQHNGWLKNGKRPAELSFQFTYSLKGMRTPLKLSRAEPIWYINEVSLNQSHSLLEQWKKYVSENSKKCYKSMQKQFGSIQYHELGASYVDASNNNCNTFQMILNNNIYLWYASLTRKQLTSLRDKTKLVG